MLPGTAISALLHITERFKTLGRIPGYPAVCQEFGFSVKVRLNLQTWSVTSELGLDVVLWSPVILSHAIDTVTTYWNN